MRTGMVALLLGVALASYLPFSTDFLQQQGLLWLLYGAIAAAVVGLFWYWPSRIGGVACGALLGLAYGCLHTLLTFQHLLWPAQEDELQELHGLVVGLPYQELRYGQRVQRFDLLVSASRWQVSSRPLRLVRLSWYDGPEVEVGQAWTLRLKLRRPRGFANPGGFDYQLYQHQVGIDATGYVKWGRPESERGELTAWQYARLSLSEWRAGFARSLTGSLQGHDSQRFIRALAIGDSNALLPADWELLRRTGTTHLFVISGLHIGLFAGFAYALSLLLLRLILPLCPGLVAQQFAAVVACLAAISYAALAGFSVPTQRAMIMVVAAALARSAGRRLDLSSVFLAAASLIVILQPLALRSAGFYLSFGAVAALLYAFSHRLRARRGWWHSAFRAQWVSFLVLSPILLLWFQSSTLIMPLTNLIAVPLITLVIVPLCLLCLLFTASSIAVPTSLLAMLEWVLARFWSALRWLDQWAGAWSQFDAAIDSITLTAAILTALILLAPRALNRRLVMFCPLLLLPLFSGRLPSWAQQPINSACDTATFSVLDVGQGLASVFKMADKTLVYDVGARFSDRFDAGSAVVAPYLRSLGVRRLDRLVISHSDSDHAGGVAGLLSEISVEHVDVNSDVFAGLDYSHCAADRAWRWGQVQFRYLHPELGGESTPLPERDQNNRSCVLSIEAPGFRILLPGDIEMLAEQQLINSSKADLAADIVVMPHHGSRTSSGQAFVDAVNAQFAIASAAYKGRFGHPHESVVARYQSAGTEVLTTAHAGAIEFSLPICTAASFPEPRLYRRSIGNYWLAW